MKKIIVVLFTLFSASLFGQDSIQKTDLISTSKIFDLNFFQFLFQKNYRPKIIQHFLLHTDY